MPDSFTTIFPLPTFTGNAEIVLRSQFLVSSGCKLNRKLSQHTAVDGYTENSVTCIAGIDLDHT